MQLICTSKKKGTQKTVGDHGNEQRRTRKIVKLKKKTKSIQINPLIFWKPTTIYFYID